MCQESLMCSTDIQVGGRKICLGLTCLNVVKKSFRIANYYRLRTQLRIYKGARAPLFKIIFRIQKAESADVPPSLWSSSICHCVQQENKAFVIVNKNKK